MLRGIGCVLEDILTRVVVFGNETFCESSINSGYRQDHHNVEGHEGVDSFVKS